MAKACWTFEHTADVGLEARADSLAECFEAMGEGLAEQICPKALVQPRREVPVAIEAEDVENLLHDFLAAVLELFCLDRLVPVEVTVEQITRTSVKASVRGEDFDPARHELGTEIKAVTYHLLSVTRDAHGWLGRAVLDI